MAEWISVNERLPEDGRVLCVRKSEYFRGRRYIDILISDHGWFRDGAFFVSDGNVTHWMPLPELPKEGGGEDG
jgi:hypothetical protein